MHAEALWTTDDEMPSLLWRCEKGHITQALPIPDAMLGDRDLVPPRLT